MIILPLFSADNSRSRDSSPQKEQPKGLVSVFQNILPSWLTGSVKESSTRGNKRKHRPKAASQTTDGDARERRRRRRARQSTDAVAENIRKEEGESRENDLRRRSRRKARKKKESVVEGYPNSGYDGELAWDTVSIDSATL